MKEFGGDGKRRGVGPTCERLDLLAHDVDASIVRGIEF